MAVPKRKQSKARRDKRRSNVWSWSSYAGEMSSVWRTQGAPSGLWQVWLLQGRRSCQG